MQSLIPPVDPFVCFPTCSRGCYLYATCTPLHCACASLHCYLHYPPLHGLRLGYCVCAGELHELLTAEPTIRQSLYCAIMSRLPGSGVRSAYFAATLNWLDLPAAAVATAALAKGYLASQQSTPMEVAEASAAEAMAEGVLAPLESDSNGDAYYLAQVLKACALLLLSLRQLKVSLSRLRRPPPLSPSRHSSPLPPPLSPPPPLPPSPPQVLLNIPMTGPLVMMVIRTPRHASSLIDSPHASYPRFYPLVCPLVLSTLKVHS